MVRGFAADKIAYSDVRYYENTDYAETNMVESLMAAKQGFDDDVIVSYSDILFGEGMLKGMMASAEDFAVAVDATGRYTGRQGTEKLILTQRACHWMKMIILRSLVWK